MEDSTLQARQKAYREILHWALLAIREAASAGKSKLCETEADHLHNLPSLFDEQNEHRHRYYIASERELYLDRMKEQGETQYLEDRMRWYAEAWKTLMTLAIPDKT